MNNMEITRFLPHRKPFLFVDEVETRADGIIVGSYHFTESDFFFAGHFPGFPVVPGVILVEAMAQCGGAGLVQSGAIPYKYHFFMATMKDIKFRRKVVPDETVRFEIRTLRVSHKMLRQKGHCYVGDELAAEAEWMCVITPQSA